MTLKALPGYLLSLSTRKQVKERTSLIIPSDGLKRSDAITKKKPRYFYGWNIVAASFLVHLSYAQQYATVLGLFFKPFQRQFGWSRTEMSLTHTIARMTEALAAPVVGSLADRYGPRLLVPIGTIIAGLGMLSLIWMTTIWQFYLLRGIIASIGFTLAGALVTDLVVNNWFVQKRGRALATSRLGGNVSNVIFTPLTIFVIAAYGWQRMFLIFATVTWLVGLIPPIILMRRRPEDMGLYPDGIQPGIAEAKNNQKTEVPPANEVTSVEEPIWSRREVMKIGSFWLLVIAFGVESMAFQGINVSLAPYIQDLGYSEAALAAVMTFRVVVMAAAVPFMGFVAEHAHRVAIRVIPLVVEGVAVFFLLSAEQPVFLWASMFLYGLGLSAIQIIQEVIWADYFGRLSLGVVRSTAYVFAFGFGATGPLAMNAVFDILGSYRPAFIAIVALLFVSAFLVGVTRPPKPQRYATAAEMRLAPEQRR
ncbi:MAG: MFS transporter [Chloroflexi bacterium]|nr:MFS transporter [Chloroflexota bacterium]